MTESPSPKALTTLADKPVLQNPQHNTLALKLKYLERYTFNSPPQTLSPTAPKPQTPKSPSKEAAATWHSTWQTVVQRGTLQTQRGFLLYTTLADAGQTQAIALLWSSVCMVGRCRWSKPIIQSGFPYGSIDADTAPFSGVHAGILRFPESFSIPADRELQSL